MLKDLGGNSLGKRITGFKVISVIGDEKPKITQLLVRNLFVFFIPFDAMMVLLRSDHRRIGDLLAKTTVIRTN